jgi:hypothetical protein
MTCARWICRRIAASEFAEREACVPTDKPDHACTAKRACKALRFVACQQCNKLACREHARFACNVLLCLPCTLAVCFCSVCRQRIDAAHDVCSNCAPHVKAN